MFCIQCGNKIQKEMKFCPSCGNANVEFASSPAETLPEKICPCEENVCRCSATVCSNVGKRTGGAGLAVAGFVCGIVAFCLAATLATLCVIFPQRSFLTSHLTPGNLAVKLIIVLSILGNCFSAAGLATSQGKGKAVAGFVLATLALTFALFCFL